MYHNRVGSDKFGFMFGFEFFKYGFGWVWEKNQTNLLRFKQVLDNSHTNNFWTVFGQVWIQALLVNTPKKSLES